MLRYKWTCFSILSIALAAASYYVWPVLAERRQVQHSSPQEFHLLKVAGVLAMFAIALGAVGISKDRPLRKLLGAIGFFMGLFCICIESLHV